MGLEKRKPDDSLFWPSWVSPIPMRLRREIREAVEKQAREKEAAAKAKKAKKAKAK